MSAKSQHRKFHPNWKKMVMMMGMPGMRDHGGVKDSEDNDLKEKIFTPFLVRGKKTQDGQPFKMVVCWSFPAIMWVSSFFRNR